MQGQPPPPQPSVPQMHAPQAYQMQQQQQAQQVQMANVAQWSQPARPTAASPQQQQTQQWQSQLSHPQPYQQQAGMQQQFSPQRPPQQFQPSAASPQQAVGVANLDGAMAQMRLQSNTQQQPMMQQGQMQMRQGQTVPAMQQQQQYSPHNQQQQQFQYQTQQQQQQPQRAYPSPNQQPAYAGPVSPSHSRMNGAPNGTGSRSAAFHSDFSAPLPDPSAVAPWDGFEADPTVAGTPTPDWLSAYAVVNERAVAEACPLPLGVLLAPAVHLYPQPPQLERAPQCCRVCGACVNLYCKLQPGTGGTHRWTCVLCGTEQTFVPATQHLVQQPAHAPYANGSGSSGSWQPPPSPSPAIAADVALPPEFAFKVLESVQPAAPGAALLPPTVFPASASAARNGAASLPFPQPLPHPRGTGAGLNYFFVLDRNLPRSECSALKRSLGSLVRSLPPHAGLALLSFGNVVSLYDLRAAPGVAACDVFSGEQGPGLEEFEGFIEQHGVELPRVSAVLDTFLDCLESFEQGSAAASSSSDPSSASDAQAKLLNPRALGAAVEWVAAMVQAGRELDQLTLGSGRSGAGGASFAFSQALLLTSGPPDFGPGETTLEEHTAENAAAASFFHGAGTRARALNLQYDYSCQGGANFSAPIVRKLVDPSGGAVYMHKSFGPVEDATGTGISPAMAPGGGAPSSASGGDGHGDTGADSDSPWLQDMRQVLFRAVGYDGELELRFSSGLRVSRVIGAVTSISDRAAPAAAAATPGEDESADPKADKESAARVGFLRLQLSNLRPDSSLSLYLRLRDDLPQQYATLQYSLSYRDWNHQRVRRTWTRRVRTTGNYNTFVRSMDARVAAVLLLKKIVLRAVHGEHVHKIQKEIDDRVRVLCSHFGRERSASEAGSSGSSGPPAPAYDMPAELSQLPLLLYHVRRGPLLGPVVQHPDDVDVLRFGFLHAGRADALRAAMPALLGLDARGGLEELPLQTLALQSGRILFLDHHSQIMIWSGSDVSGPAYAAYRSACVSRAQAATRWRLPRAEVLVFAEGSSAARWMLARLAPAHQDPPAWQEEAFPQLRLLDPAQRQQLQSKFFPTDELSFAQYCQKIFGKGK